MTSSLPVAGPLPVARMVAAATSTVVGRTREIEVIAAALGAGRSILLEGPPGTGKTTLLRGLAAGAGVELILVEGNAELSPARLVGHHDPSRVLTEDYQPHNFVPGPLVRAMTGGALLYVEELNRIPEETLNVLLAVLSERRMHVPRFGPVDAEPSFRLVAAMNPFDAVGTGRITPALYDRSCRVGVGYQSEDEETNVVTAQADGATSIVRHAVRAVRRTRDHTDLRLGASVRGAVDTVAVAAELGALRGEPASSATTGLDAALTALSGRVTVAEGVNRSAEDIITDIWHACAEPEQSDSTDDVDGEQGKATTPITGANPTSPASNR